MDIREKIKRGFTFFDGGTGTVLQKKGLLPGELPEEWNLTHPAEIADLHLSYINAGCHIINANTFGANILKFDKEKLKAVIFAAAENAQKARRLSGRDDVYIALDIGPTGKLLKPFGELDFEDAVAIFAETVKIAAGLGFDLINIETMTDSYETKAAVLAAKENSDLPVFATNVYNERGKLMTGADVPAMVATLEGLGVDALGLNCSLGPKEMKDLVPVFYEYASVPVIVSPNAGLPVTVDGETVYNVHPEDFSDEMVEIAKRGAVILGGCCGTTPEYIKMLTEKVKRLAPRPVCGRNKTLVSSYDHAVEIGKKPVIIGERINPTGKKLFKEALKNHDIDYILNEGFTQQEAGAHILDVNVGLPEIDEPKILTETVTELQSVINLPLQIDTSDIAAMEQAMRLYNGKPMVNSVNGKQEIMDSVFPLVKKYGGVVVGLTLDEDGIPATAEGRVKIAEKIYSEGEKYGIAKKDIVIDPLTLTVSTGSDNGKVTLDAVKAVHDMGGNTVLGVSNVSFGLPDRAGINSIFYTLALNAGLSSAIINPKSRDMMRAYYSFCVLMGYDDNFSEYIAFASENEEKKPANEEKESDPKTSLKNAVLKGLCDKAERETEKLLAENQPTEIIDGILIPALDEVGQGFESNKIFLPQLLMSAEAAGKAFDVIKLAIKSKGGETVKKGTVALATVKGDIHDIGKNIVKVILENYGFEVIDLGKDVPPEDVVRCVKTNGLKLCGLSALMTSTVPAMEETIKLLNKETPECKVVVGGAVLTQEYADMIGADKYAKDAMETVRYAEEIFG
ncbi:MAG: homocysteine S-methyltransferase family protein [Clostridiales bacterium]|nr:homocysteine S-methyltransferase family protein [Clostridiales bacterium]